MKKLLLSSLMLMLALPAFAFNVPMPEGMKLNIYGTLRMDVHYQHVDNDVNGVDNQDDVKFLLQGNSRVGFTFDLGKVYGNFEIGYAKNVIRQMWAGYKFDNGGYFILGQKTSLASTTPFFNQVYFNDNQMNGFGAIGDDRRPMLQYGYKGFDIALIALTNNDDDYANYKNVFPAVGTAKGATLKHEYMPRIEASYNAKLSNMQVRVFGGVSTVDLEYTKAEYNYATGTMSGTSKDEFVTAFVVGAGLKPQLGPVYLAVTGFYSSNYGLNGGTLNNPNRFDAKNAFYGITPTGQQVYGLDANGNRVVVGYDGFNDVNTWGVAAAVGFKLISLLDVQIGAGYSSSESDGYKFTKSSTTAGGVTYNQDEDYNINGLGVYIQAAWKLNQWITLTPEVDYLLAEGARLGTTGTTVGNYTVYDNEKTSANAILAGLQVKFDF